VLTDTSQTYRRTHARNFALQGVAWSLGLFGLVRLSWFETHAVLPLTHLQAGFAQRAFGPPVLPIDVTLACSGADAFALSVGAILAYPAIWRGRLAAAVGAIALILTLNIARIGTLGRAAGSSWFDPLHLYVWPALLTLALAGYVFSWMRVASITATETPVSFSVSRFVLLSGIFLVLFLAASPYYLESTAILGVASFVARAAAFTLTHLGIPASVAGNVLWTARGGFLVTQECITTPLIPVYVAAVFAYSQTWTWRALAFAAAAPLFVALGIARLLIVALPAALVGSPLFLIHAFYQLLLAVLMVVVAALWRHGSSTIAWRRAILGTVAGGLLVYFLSGPTSQALVSIFFSPNAPFSDPQGAIALLPSFQIGLYLSLCVAVFATFTWRPFVVGLAMLTVLQVTAFAMLRLFLEHGGLTPHVRDVRGWTLAAPILIVAALVAYDRPRR
jgi:exosortase/archaeosortase family protein